MPRVRMLLQGLVQGIGIRPQIARQALEYRVTGFVHNSSEGVLIEAQAQQQDLEQFIQALPLENLCWQKNIPLEDESEFTIKPSMGSNKPTFCIGADTRTCAHCLREYWDKNNRRYLYPLISCIDCGPRFSIIKKLPYDRAHTTLANFPPCRACSLEYNDIHNRRYHAQTINCATCGPQIRLLTATGASLASSMSPIDYLATEIKAGKIVAVKGIGGFHLIADATQSQTVQKLRKIKHRKNKPFAYMLDKVEAIPQHYRCDRIDKKALESEAAPIVVLNNRQTGKPTQGFILAYTALHQHLCRVLKRPIIVTSANISGSPIATTAHTVTCQFSDTISCILDHNRDISQPLDDSVVRVMAGKMRVIRRARGIAITIKQNADLNTVPLIASGGDNKNTFALSDRNNVVISPHIGDLNQLATASLYQDSLAGMQQLIGHYAQTTLIDQHPGFIAPTLFPTENMKSCVQHHHAHMASVMLEHQLTTQACGHIWDGTGFGLDETIWGGESFVYDQGHFKRIATLQPFFLLGNDQAIQFPTRTAFALLQLAYQSVLPARWQNWCDQYFSTDEQQNFKIMQQRKINTSTCSSIGRLIDAVAALLQCCQENTYEGEAAHVLESNLSTQHAHRDYLVKLKHKGPLIYIDWSALIYEITADLEAGLDIITIINSFHHWLVAVLCKLSSIQACRRIILSGGVFQNKWLTEMAHKQLTALGYCVYLNKKIPCNDGGLSAGQLYAHVLSVQERICA